MQYSIQHISEIINGSLHGEVKQNIFVRNLLIDSRSISSPEASVFFAITGERHDGHKFIADAYKKGVRNFVVSKLTDEIQNLSNANYIVVKDTLEALQRLSAEHRKKFNIPVIGITGSNGKTIVKEWLYQLMHDAPDTSVGTGKNIVRSPKSYNSQVGVPLSVWQMNEHHELAIFEAGISKPNEMEKLQSIISPTIGILTNIGQAHDENFQSEEQKISEKLKLFSGVQTIIYCKDNSKVNEQINSESSDNKASHFSWSRFSKANLQAGKISKSNEETEIQAVYNNSFINIRIPFSDEASIENAIHCWAAMLFLGYSNDTIAARMKNLSPVEMRLELKEGANYCSVINDSYNSDLGSLAIALDFLSSQKQHPKKTLVLSDILQSGKNEEALYKEVGSMVKQKGISRMIGIGKAISEHSHLFETEKSFYETTEQFLIEFPLLKFENETILLKGARTFGFERIGRLLQQKAHETVLEITLNAIVHNLNFFRSKLAPETKIMTMVKAFSYGSGSFEIANVLQHHLVDYLAVAYSDEGIELRKAGISLPVMVMNPEEQSYESMIRYDLEPEIFSFRVLKLFNDAVKRYGRKDSPYPVHIKLDTGMHRLGFEEKEINELVVRIRNTGTLEIRSVFSHLAASDEKIYDEFTRQQIKKFGAMSEIIRSHFDYPILRHILNSSGISRFPGAQFEMVRLGIGLYGIGTDEAEQEQLQNVSTLKTVISQIKNISSGESVGYSRKFIASKETRIATVPVGYADGLSRRLGNGKGKMIVNGKKASIIGNVCMDMCMLDVTDILCSEGDEVLVFGKEYPVYELAKDMDTIPYEVFTGISGRVKRVYFQE